MVREETFTRGDFIKILLFGDFGESRSEVLRWFDRKGQTELTEYDVPLSSFVNARFKGIAAEADLAIHGGEPRYRPYIALAKKTDCKLALWDCDAAWVARCHSTIPLFDIIFAKDKESYAKLREMGFDNVVLPPKPKGQTPEEPPAEQPILPMYNLGGLFEEEDDEEDLSDIVIYRETVDDEDAEAPQTESAESSIAFAKDQVHELGFRTSAYAICNRLENVRAQSSAGGFFSLLCEDVLAKEGVVFGAVFDKDFETAHIKAERMAECTFMRGIKYTKSKNDSVYAEAVSSLRQGKWVLFSGTACQVERLYKTLEEGVSFAYQKDHPRLLAVDVACGGVADLNTYQLYLKYIREKIGASITAVDLSFKQMGWSKASVRIGSENGTYEISESRDPFLAAYRAGLCLSEECYSCPRRKIERESDLTLSSFRRGHKYIPELQDDKGASLVLAHSQKGAEAIEAISSRAIVRELPSDAISEYNESITSALVKHENYDTFKNDLNDMRFDKALKKNLGFFAGVGIHSPVPRILSLWRKSD